ncbi:biliverdin-producing heme oxygenase [Allosphingosinicella indica]|uniref:Heme oxygenase n=1 Tax=Allosphingosinicella indica TaxID=941907 RepID=A0A1X7GZ72_9SPHN|nr:biliverdin-producing heme oxygenase [Allosphingosinicella indica]SMF77034.1 heme oxygenase [Allosphingosinicella indica]
MSTRAALRARTAEEHERVDALFGRFDLASEDGYRGFLAAQAGAFLPIEEALDAAGIGDLVPDWHERRRGDALRADLSRLGVAIPDGAHPVFAGEADVLGALYVLEGSRLGGSLLKKSIQADFPRAFLDAPQPPGAWRKLLALIDVTLNRPDQTDRAVEAACMVFGAFESSGARVLELGRA